MDKDKEIWLDADLEVIEFEAEDIITESPACPKNFVCQANTGIG